MDMSVSKLQSMAVYFLFKNQNGERQEIQHSFIPVLKGLSRPMTKYLKQYMI